MCMPNYVKYSRSNWSAKIKWISLIAIMFVLAPKTVCELWVCLQSGRLSDPSGFLPTFSHLSDGVG